MAIDASTAAFLPPPIVPLPKSTIDLIAAGEVIQRPASIVKELIENSLDARSTLIEVNSRSPFDLSVSDNGIGIRPQCMTLACTRFATSKIQSVDDLRNVQTFGFRGEALASCSMVGKVGITTRVRGGACAYRMNFSEGKPVGDYNPSAGKEGTVIQVQDLFYNLPSRRRAMEGKRSERDEYERLLNVVQRYAVHEARRGVAFLCRGGGGRTGNHYDLNTQSLMSLKKLQEKRKNDFTPDRSLFDDEIINAVKDAIGHVFGSDLIRELIPLSAGEGDVDAVGLEALKATEATTQSKSSPENENADNEMSTEDTSEYTKRILEEMMMGSSVHGQYSKVTKTPSRRGREPISDVSSKSKFSFAYRASGLITNGSYSAPKAAAAFLLFINDRLVESTSLRRAIESVYADTLPKAGKPFVYLSLELPGPHVDVNVHPTKKGVTLLHEDRLCDAVADAVKEVIGGASSSRTFVSAVTDSSVLKENGGLKSQVQSTIMGCPKISGFKGNEQSQKIEIKENRNSSIAIQLEKKMINSISQNQVDDSDTIDLNSEPKVKRKIVPDERMSSSSKKSPNPSRLVRTSRAVMLGALEPFLVKTDGETRNSSAEAKNTGQSSVDPNIEVDKLIRHQDGCPRADQSSPDMTVPGAFALAICRCQIQGGDNLPSVSDNSVVVRSNPLNVVRLKKVTPTECNYESITNLRTDITTKNHQGLNEILRCSTYLGTVSRSRSLIQSGIDLLMVNHRDLARELFYQLALLTFGDMPMASLGTGGVNVNELIGHFLQASETQDLEDISVQKINETNVTLAHKATSCLAEKAPMLEDYFSIKFENQRLQGHGVKESLYLTGLPVLLDGHSPQPHALPLFLIRIATSVDWTVEQVCFHGICTEIGSYYAELPVTNFADEMPSENADFIDDEAKSHVQHCLFPAISHLLVPPTEFATNGAVIKLANLTSLYKVFERC